MPRWLGITSENAAHRAAVEWDEGDKVREGVYIWRRDTSSWLNALAGGRVFPGMQSHARFNVQESDTHFEVALQSDDGITSLSVVGDLSDRLPTGSAFDSLADASRFFEKGSLGYSATPDPQRFHGIELWCERWQVEPLAVSAVQSSYFNNGSVFPTGSIEFDCALLMRGVEHEWHGKQDICCTQPASPELSLHR